MKRWVAALVAVFFLSTATLHILAHRGEAEGACTVCQVQSATLTAVAAPQVVVVLTAETVPPRASVSPALSERVASAPARAPPALPA